MKKNAFICLILILTTIVLYFYSIFNGIPFYKYYSKLVIVKYLTQKYPNNNFEIQGIVYNHKNNSFQANIFDNINKTDFVIDHYWMSNTLHDPIYSDLISERLNEIMKPLVYKEILNDKDIDIKTSVWSTIKLNQDFSNDDLVRYDRVYIWVYSNKNYSNKTKQEFVNLAYQILSHLKNTYYNTTKTAEISIAFKDKIMSLYFDKFDETFTSQDVLRLIKVIEK